MANMISFSEAVKGFSQYKVKNGGSAAITKEELAAVREAYKNGEFKKVNTGAKRNAKPALKENLRINDALVRKFSKYKESKGLSPKVTLHEAIELTQKAYKKATQSFSVIVEKYSKYKEAKGFGKNVTRAEMEALKEGLQKKTQTSKLAEAVKQYSKFKEAQGYGRKVTSAEVRELKEGLQKKFARGVSKPATIESVMTKVREARRNVYKAKKLLREGDMMGAQDATMGAMDATAQADAGMNAMNADPNDMGMQEPVPQNIIDAVSSIKASIDDLATQCGIEPAMDPGADAQAGVPGMTGVADPNAMGMDPAAGAQPVMESTAAIRRRLNARAAKINGIKENVKPEFANPLGDIGGKNIPAEERTVATKNDEYQLGNIPSAAAIAKGTDKKVVRWPSEPMKNVPKSLVESMIDQKIQKDRETLDFAQILQSGVLG